MCETDLPSDRFSAAQRHKPGPTRRCTQCVDAAQSGNKTGKHVLGKRAADSGISDAAEPGRSGVRPSKQQVQKKIEEQKVFDPDVDALRQEFRGCTPDIPKEERMSTLIAVLTARAQARCGELISDAPPWYLPSAYSSVSETAEPGQAPSGADARASLARDLVAYGERTVWTQKPGHVWTSLPASCQPCGPPLVADLLEIQRAQHQKRRDSRERDPLSESIRAEAGILLRSKGVEVKYETAGNKYQADEGVYTVGDPPIVKFTRARHVQMVTALLDAGVPVDQCQMWTETGESWYKNDYNWRGDSALMAAARAGNREMCQLLLDRGASRSFISTYCTNCYTDDHESDISPQAAAARMGHVEVAEFISSYIPQKS